MSKIKVWVCGLFFDPNREFVILQQKEYPAEYKGEGRLPQFAGHINGVGGLVQQREPFMDAMQRKFRAEMGVDTSTDQWKQFAQVSGKDWHVVFFKGFAKDMQQFKNAKSMTDEEKVVVPIAALSQYPVIFDMRWLVPMALDEHVGYSYLLHPSTEHMHYSKSGLHRDDALRLTSSLGMLAGAIVQSSAEEFAREELKEQFDTNPDAAKAIMDYFIAGANLFLRSNDMEEVSAETAGESTGEDLADGDASIV